MLIWVQGLSGEGVAGSRHARTIMWLKVAMWRRSGAACKKCCGARPPEKLGSFAVK